MSDEREQLGELDELVFREVDEDNVADFVKLFESKGAPSYCWCMAWRARGKDVQADSAERKRMMLARVDEGVPIGILAYLEGEPVAWCSVAPRATYRDLGGPKDDEDEDAVWSIVCFYVPRKLRKQGVGRRLLEAAVAHARSQGAKVVEAYPVDADSPSYRYMGFVTTFASEGFVEIGRAGSRRHVMRLALDPR